MLAPILGPADYLALIQATFPDGEVWPRDADADMAVIQRGIADGYARVNARETNLLVDGFPATTDELLPEWESSLGLPDPCQGLGPTLQQRRDQVVARLTGRGGQSIPYFVQFSNNLGYSITVTEFSPFVAGVGVAGGPCYGPDWSYAWQVNAPTYTIDYFLAGSSNAGEPLATWGNSVMQCELQRISPAHTILIFDYEG